MYKVIDSVEELYQEIEIDKKDFIKQSNLVNEFAKQTKNINTAQSVVIYQLTEKTIKEVYGNE